MCIIVVPNSIHDFPPGAAVVVCLVDVGRAIVELISLRGEVSSPSLVRRRVDETDAAERRQAGWRDVFPALAAVSGDVCETIVRPGPDRHAVERRWCDSIDGGVNLRPIH